eukprot:CAMPEP_0177638820 /NCGR_PEP_ID=MMETSP0447-20121125/5695_1 /TAXON_ID=0 /ORGANISM="Stygamoeba regulata, Strain BSH-02190019" /LENGTH=57 /DNA_ID=CAMNT_0019140813 /DNA_START=95 /DNA_END=265 /DNA_ORIENTATION=+
MSPVARTSMPPPPATDDLHSFTGRSAQAATRTGMAVCNPIPKLAFMLLAYCICHVPT